MEKEKPAWLPEPPPPRPARRDEAIEAALRKFDGIEDAPAIGERPRRSWASSHRPQLAMAFSAMLLVVVGVPAALIGIRNQPSTPEPEPRTLAARNVEAAPAATSPAPKQVAEATPPSLRPPPPLRTYRGVDRGLPVSNEPALDAAPPVVAAAPPAPAARMAEAPPPPAPPPPAGSTADVAGVAAQELVVTGTRIERPALEAPSAAKVMSAQPTYAPFLGRLQSAVKAGDRRAVIAMIAFPLRVNFPSAPRTYRDPASVQRDFDRIFTAKVRGAVLRERADELFVRDQGAMVGNGELWFRETCPNAACSGQGPVRIVAVNP